MPFLDLPAEFAEPSLLIPGIKPVGPVQVKQGHMGLRVDHFYMLGGTHTDLVSGAPAVLNNTTNNIWENTVPTPYGVSAKMEEIESNAAYIELASEFFGAPTEPTFWILHFRHDLEAESYLDMTYSSFNASGVRIRVNPTDVWFQTYYDGGGTTINGPDLGSDWTASKPVTIVIAHDPVSDWAVLAYEGVGAQSSMQTWVTEPTHSARLFRNWGMNLNGEIYAVVKGRGNMSLSMAQAISLDPYQFLEPVARPSIFLPEAATGGYFLQLPPEFADPSIMIPGHKPVGSVQLRQDSPVVGSMVFCVPFLRDTQARDIINHDEGQFPDRYEPVMTPWGLAQEGDPDLEYGEGEEYGLENSSDGFSATVAFLYRSGSATVGNIFRHNPNTFQIELTPSSIQGRFKNTDVTYSVDLRDDAFHIVTCTLQPNGDCSVILDGAVVATDSITMPTGSGASEVEIGDALAADRCVVYFATINNPPLSDAQVIAWHNDPYQFLEPTQAPMIWVPDAASPTGGYWIPDPRWENPGLMIPKIKPPGDFEVLQGHLGQEIVQWYNFYSTAGNLDLVTGYLHGFAGSVMEWGETITPRGAALNWATAGFMQGILVGDDWWEVPTEPVWYLFHIDHDVTSNRVDMGNLQYQTAGVDVSLYTTGITVSPHYSGGASGFSMSVYGDAGNNCVIMFAYDPDSEELQICANWIDGEAYQSGSSHQVWDYNSSNTGLFDQWDNNIDGGIYMAAKGRGPMTEGLMRTIVRDPYQFLIPA